MSSVRAFPYFRYNPDLIDDVGQLLCPPYDVINDQERAELAKRSEYQAVHVELPAGGDVQQAGKLFKSWLLEDVVEGGEVGLVVVRQRFVGPDGVRRERTAVCCEVPLHPFEDGVVLPHEKTFAAPRKARVELMESSGANISPVLLAYHDEERSLVDMFASITDETPDVTAMGIDGNQMAIWYVDDVALCEEFERIVGQHELLIADGHHRYTAALEYKERVAAQGPSLVAAGGSDHMGPPHTPSSWHSGVMAMVINSADAGIEVFPTHRIVSGVDPARVDEFVVGSGALAEQSFDQLDDAVAALEQSSDPGFVVVGGSKPPRLLTVPETSDMELAAPDMSDAARRLDVVALHSMLIDDGAGLAENATGGVAYSRDLDDTIARVESSPSDTVAFVMRGVPPQDILAVAKQGDVLPQKSTYYYPKVPTGAAFRLIDPKMLGLG